MNETATTPNPTTNQPFKVRGSVKFVTIIRSPTAGRVALISNQPWVKGGRVTGYYIPVEMLGLSAGKDRWLREVKVRCADPACRAIFRAGDSCTGTFCPACIEAAERENEIADGRTVTSEDGV